MAPKTLTPKEQAFVDAYLSSAGGNGTLAAKHAGYRQSQKALGVTSSRLLKKASIRAAIAARQEARADKSIAEADERDRILSTLARKNIPAHDRIAAIKELNKCSGRHSIKHLHEGKLTLEQAIGASRK